MPRVGESRRCLKMKCWIGIDPGAQGGIAAILEGGDVLLVPISESILAVYQTLDFLKMFQRFVTLEKVGSMPKQGVKSMFAFGRQVGHVELAIALTKVLCDEVIPQTWMKQVGLPLRSGETKGQRKNRLLEKAKRLYPEHAAWKQTKKYQLSVCDALLMAHRTRLTYP